MSRPPSTGEPERQGVFSHTLMGKPISSTRQQLNVLLLVFVIVVLFGGCVAVAVVQ